MLCPPPGWTTVDSRGSEPVSGNVSLFSSFSLSLLVLVSLLAELRPLSPADACELQLDVNTANRKLRLSDSNRTVVAVTVEEPYPDHPDRFNYWLQLLCTTGMTGRCYWEVEWEGEVHIAVTYRGVARRGHGYDCRFGVNKESWSLRCSDADGYSACHSNRREDLPPPSSSSHRVGVYLDCLAGSLSFYSVSSDSLMHLHTFSTSFTEALFPGFWLLSYGSSLSLCPVQ